MLKTCHFEARVVSWERDKQDPKKLTITLDNIDSKSTLFGLTGSFPDDGELVKVVIDRKGT